VLVAGGSVWVDYTDAPEAAAPTSTLAAIASGFHAATNHGAMNCPVLAYVLTDVGLGLGDFYSFMRGQDINIYFPNGSHNLEPNYGES
jgi:hypothetical protein